MSAMALKTTATHIFKKGLQSVLPRSLVFNNISVNNNTLFVGGCRYTLHRNVFVVGFGKAVLGMAIAVEELLNGHIQKGILSIPQGESSIIDELATHARLDPTSKIVAREGARNNLPDEEACKTSLEIENLARSLNKDDILIVLISGGGSALLPAPVEDVSIHDKVATIKLLASSGATIQELNTVRKHLSRLKGGKLASVTKCQSVISLILSDIVGDPLDLIASGPTVFDKSTIDDCLQILKHYGLCEALPNSVVTYLLQRKHKKYELNSNHVAPSCSEFSHVNNVIVGSNTIAVDNCLEAANHYGFLPFILSTEVTGNVKDVSKSFADIIVWFIYDIEPPEDVYFDKSVMQNAYDAFKAGECVCLLSAGETTVIVGGSGLGGRNQELALRTAAVFENQCREKNLDIPSKTASFCFLSAGTDGQDGPTPAAGASFMADLCQKARDEGLSMKDYLHNNGSYDFFSAIDNGSNLVVTGLTGTNVMDLQILLFKQK